MSVAETEALHAATKLAQDQWNKAQDVKDRAAWMKGDGFQNYIEDVRGAMQEDQHIDLVDDDRDPERVIKITPKRPWRQRSEIIRQVARETGVSERLVRECWQEFRQLQTRLRV